MTAPINSKYFIVRGSRMAEFPDVTVYSVNDEFDFTDYTFFRTRTDLEPVMDEYVFVDDLQYYLSIGVNFK